MVNLQLTIASAPNDRVAPIIDGRVRIEGCETRFFPIDPEEAFARAFNGQDFDITELSASSHILSTSRGESHYVGIPVFTMRIFRHSAIYIRTDRDIHAPQDLRGKLVGVPEYQMTAVLWARGLLSDEYGVSAREIRWRNGGLNLAGRSERTRLSLPPEIELEPVPSDDTLSNILEAGKLDAVISARPPRCFLHGAANVARLFPDDRAATEAYYRKTRMFPIMHLIAIRRSLVDEHRWLAPSVLKAFMRARLLALHEMEDVSGLSVMLPWLASDLAQAKSIMGPNLWPYGVNANRRELDAMLRWSVEQGLSQRLVTAEELFAPSTLGHFQLKDE